MVQEATSRLNAAQGFRPSYGMTKNLPELEAAVLQIRNRLNLSHWLQSLRTRPNTPLSELWRWTHLITQKTITPGESSTPRKRSTKTSIPWHCYLLSANRMEPITLVANSQAFFLRLCRTTARSPVLFGVPHGAQHPRQILDRRRAGAVTGVIGEQQIVGCLTGAAGAPARLGRNQDIGNRLAEIAPSHVRSSAGSKASAARGGCSSPPPVRPRSASLGAGPHVSHASNRDPWQGNGTVRLSVLGNAAQMRTHRREIA